VTVDEAARMRENHFFLWAPMLFEDRALTVVIEERNGRRTLEDAAWAPAGAEHWTKLGIPEHEIEFVPGTRLIKQVRLTIGQPGGEPLVVTGEPLQFIWTMMGTGYGFSDHFRHGKHMGELFVDSVRYDLSDPVVLASMKGVLDGSARFTLGDKVGFGELNYGIFGAYSRVLNRRTWRH
jgi:hypothetical protein